MDQPFVFDIGLQPQLNLSKEDCILKLANEKINVANILLSKLINLEENTYGILKLKRKIEAEIKFLQKKLLKKELKVEHVYCSNINQLKALVNAAASISDVSSVLKSFDKGDNGKITVDIVGENGLKWYKIIYRDPKALHHVFIFGGKNGVRSMKSVGQDFILSAKLNPQFFSEPKVCFIFVKGVSSSLAVALQEIGIEIQGQIIKDEDLGTPRYTIGSSSDEEEFSEEDSCQKICMDKNVEKINNFVLPSFNNVNLDVTCLIAFVSATSNGGCNYIFEDEFLTEQAKSEKKCPVIIVLNSYFQGKNLIVCKSAVDHFCTILETIGGHHEKERGDHLLKRCNIIDNEEDILQGKLKIGGRIKKLSRLIFSTGISHRAPTITSNRGFIRAAINQGVDIAALYHEPRALTERKESKAIKL